MRSRGRGLSREPIEKSGQITLFGRGLELREHRFVRQHARDDGEQPEVRLVANAGEPDSKPDALAWRPFDPCGDRDNDQRVAQFLFPVLVGFREDDQIRIALGDQIDVSANVSIRL